MSSILIFTALISVSVNARLGGTVTYVYRVLAAGFKLRRVWVTQDWWHVSRRGQHRLAVSWFRFSKERQHKGWWSGVTVRHWTGPWGRFVWPSLWHTLSYGYILILHRILVLAGARFPPQLRRMCRSALFCASFTGRNGNKTRSESVTVDTVRASNYRDRTSKQATAGQMQAVFWTGALLLASAVNRLCFRRWLGTR
jgi:hypothetical protein